MSKSLPFIHTHPTGVDLHIKVVPGARRSRIAGVLGDRLKISVAAPPEKGKANAAVCAMLAELFDLPARSVTVIAGRTQPRKTIRLAAARIDAVQAAIDRAMS